MVVSELIPSAELQFVGGSTVSMTRLADWLSQNGHQVTVFCGTSREGAARLSAAALPWHSVVPFVMRAPAASSAYGIEFSIRVFGHLIRGLARDTYDLVHCHSGFGQVAAAPLAAAAIRRTPYLHSLYCPVPQGDNSNGPHGRFLLRLLRRASALIAMSGRVAESLEPLGIDRRHLHIVPPVIPVAEPTRSGRAWVQDVVGAAPSDPLVLYVGNLQDSKGLSCLVESLPAILMACPNARVVATLELQRAGYSKKKEKLVRRLEQLGIGERVVWVGITHHLTELLERAHVVVAPLRHTSGPSDYPLVILEAMSIGTPAVATSVGGIPEIVHHNETGVLVPPDDSTALARAVIRVLTDKDLSRHLVTGGRAMVARFRPNVVGEQVCRIYEGVLADR